MVFEGLAFVPQTENVFANLTVAENLELAAALLGADKRERLSPVYAMFPDLATPAALERRAAIGRPAPDAGGGARADRATACARCSTSRRRACSPKLVLQVFDKLREVRDGGVSVLLVEQNVKAALALADRAAVLVEGRERVVAPCAELRGDARIAELYLGRHAAAVPVH